MHLSLPHTDLTSFDVVNGARALYAHLLRSQNFRCQIIITAFVHLEIILNLLVVVNIMLGYYFPFMSQKCDLAIRICSFREMIASLCVCLWNTYHTITLVHLLKKTFIKYFVLRCISSNCTLSFTSPNRCEGSQIVIEGWSVFICFPSTDACYAIQQMC